MENREFEKEISSVICELVPADSFEKISDRIAKGDMPESGKIKMNQANRIKKFVFPAVAACVFLIVSVVFGLTYYGNNYAVAAVIDIDVNPSIEISINKKEKVLKVEALNDDGKEIIEGLEFEKEQVETVVDDIVGAMVDKGYVVDDEESGILVTVKNKDHKKAEKFREKIVKDFDKALCEREVEAPVINQTATDVERAKDFAEKNDVSVGKATFIEKLVEADETLSAEELAEMSIKEIMELLKANDIEIEKIAHCHRHELKGKPDVANPEEKEEIKTPENEVISGETDDSVNNDIPEKNEADKEPEITPEEDCKKPEKQPVPQKGESAKPGEKEDAEEEEDDDTNIEEPVIPDKDVPQEENSRPDNKKEPAEENLPVKPEEQPQKEVPEKSEKEDSSAEKPMPEQNIEPMPLPEQEKLPQVPDKESVGGKESNKPDDASKNPVTPGTSTEQDKGLPKENGTNETPPEKEATKQQDVQKEKNNIR